MLVENLPVPFDRRVWMEATTLRDAGYRVTVICPQGKYRRLYEIVEGVTVFRYPLPSLGGIVGHMVEYAWAMSATALLAVIASFKGAFRVVHAANPPDTMFLIGLLFKPFGARFIFDHHDLVPESCLPRWSGRKLRLMLWLTRAAERGTFRTADLVISTNESYRSIALGRGRIPPDRVHVVRSAPRLAFTKVRPLPELRRGFDYAVAYLGVMGPQDGLDILLHAIARIRHDLKRRDVHFTLIGDGDERPRLMKLAETLDLVDQVEFTGRIPDQTVIAILSSVDLGVAPDPLDPLNDLSTMNKIVEYMAIGLPIVAFDLREARVTAAECAAYAKPNYASDFAANILKLLDEPALREDMSARARERFESVLSWERQQEALLKAYAFLDNSRRSGRSTDNSVRGRFRA